MAYSQGTGSGSFSFSAGPFSPQDRQRCLSRLTDEALMAETAAGNSSAFDELYLRYRSYIRNYVQGKIRGDAVDDVVQETFIRLYRSAGSFDPSRQLRQWLFTIATNEIRRQWTRSGRAAKVLTALHADDDHAEEFDSLFTDSGPGPYELAVATLLSAQLKKAIEALPEFQRTALLLRTYRGMSLQQIALATHSRIPTVSSRLHYAQEKIKRMLDAGSLASA